MIPQGFERFRPYLRPHRGTLAVALVTLIAAKLAQLAEPWPLKIVVDTVLRNQTAANPAQIMAVCALALLVAVGLKSLLQYAATTLFTGVAAQITRRLRADLFDHLQRLSPDFHDKARSGDMVMRLVGDVGMLRDAAVTAAMPLMGNGMILAGMAGVMLWLDWRLALIALAPLPVLSLLTRRLSSRIGDASRAQRKRDGALAATAGEVMGGMRAIQALGLQDATRAIFGQANDRSKGDAIRAGRMSAGLERLVDALVGVALAAVLWFGAHAVLAGRLSPGDLLVFMTYLKNTFRPMREYAKFSGRLAKASAASDRVFGLLDTAPSIADRPDARPAPALRGEIGFHDIHFAYGPRPVLRGLDLTVPAGQSVAVTGASGIGKSTLLSLLLRMREAQSGHVTLDGTDIAAFTLASLRASVAYVPQEPLILTATVAENIALGAGREVTRAEIEDAARLASAEAFIRALPDGFDHRLTERGATLSAGQRQRIGIARAALRDTRLLLLDEPTVGLDSANEAAVAEAISRLSVGRTVLMVTHDLALAARCDRIVVLDDGRVAEDGPHPLLLARGGRYAALWRTQQEGRHAVAS